jgi:Domain of unknown function (DUF4129)
MSQQAQRAEAGADRRRAVLRSLQGRLVLAAGLLVLVAVALRGRLPAPALDGPFRRDGLAVAAVLEGVLACLLVALIVRHRRAPRAALVAARLRTMLTYLVGAGLVAIPAAYLLGRAQKVHLRPRPTTPHPTPSGSPRPLGLGHNNGSLSGLIVVIILLALVAAAAIYVIARFIRSHRWTWAGWRGAGSVMLDASAADDEEPGLLEAVSSGQSALRELDDARAAIIACYVAMEESLALAGTARDAADTPYALLVRAADRGLIRTSAAARLTELFYEARFSSHPMPPSRRDEARQALAELAASLAEAGAESDAEPMAGAPG